MLQYDIQYFPVWSRRIHCISFFFVFAPFDNLILFLDAFPLKNNKRKIFKLLLDVSLLHNDLSRRYGTWSELRIKRQHQKEEGGKIFFLTCDKYKKQLVKKKSIIFKTVKLTMFISCYTMQFYTCIYCYICIFMIKSLNFLTLCCCFNRPIITPIFRHYIYLMFQSNIYICPQI